ncbi:MAG: hypothetical protein APR54_12935 [Candidatus Cloacimonas sp. SDB]|nr:MAG: hypothetical protein APR54_12935 [Candidatus Cloacimonas sp. SDB]
MKKLIIIFALINCFLLNGELKLLEQTKEFLTVEIEFEEFEITESDDFTHFSAESWEGSEIIGSPDLPQKTVNFIIPPGGNIEISIISSDSYRENISKPIAPIPVISEFNKTNKYDYIINQDLYQKGFNDHVIQKEISRYRYYDYIPVTINPISIISEREVQINRKMILRIEIIGAKNYQHNFKDKFENVYSNLFLNYTTGKNWQTIIEKDIARIPFESSEFWYKFHLDREGIYKLTENELQQLPDFYDPESLRLLTLERIMIDNGPNDYEFRLKEIPLLFDEHTEEIFFKYERTENGLPQFSLFDHFWLTFGGDFNSPPLREENLPKTLAREVNEFSKHEKQIGADRARGISSLYICPQEFYAQTQVLTQFHSNHYGLDTYIAVQEEIFAEYGGGEADPVAIKNYIQDFWQDNSEQDSLKYVILVGSGTRDWLNNTEKNKIITYSTSDDNFVTFTAGFAELIIGRIPAQNQNQLDFYLDRLSTYVQDSPPGWWRNKMVILADDENKDGDVEGFTTNSGLNHTNLAQLTQNAMNDGLYVDKVLGLEYNFDEYNNKPDARDALLEKVNNGCLIWYFIGHGNHDVLGDEDYFRGSQHLRLLDNEQHLPVFLAASCSVGEFDSPAYDCIAERLLFQENGGSIASLAASRICSGTANTTILKEFLKKIVNERYNLGDALYYAKTSTQYTGTAKLYNLLGDPVMSIIPPLETGYIGNVPDSIRMRELVSINADMQLQNTLSAAGTLRVFDSKYQVYYTNTLNDHTYEVTYDRNGSVFFRGEVEIAADNFSASFIVPDDIRFGERGLIINYIYNELTGSDYITYAADIKYSSVSVDSISNDSPQVSLWLDSRSFISGDYVSDSPLVIAEIEDSNGINILGSAGHKILVLLDDEYTPIDVTEQFNYFTGSYTSGELLWRLYNLDQGQHYLRLIVFDNFNNPTIAETEFRVRRSGKLSIEQMLVYPNPLEKDGHFTFIITEDSNITISIYTITGKKIKTIRKEQCNSGYNQIYWDGKDGDGDKIANNTYFYKIRAKQLGNGEVTEKIGKLIILK